MTNALSGKTHIISFDIDDGFKKSCTRMAAIFEKYQLSASFNVLASSEYGGLPNDLRPNFPAGDFGLWNELQDRGHAINPHGWSHSHKGMLPFEISQFLIKKCLATFTEKLAGFDAKRSVFAFPYNASTPQLDAWMPSVVRAFRAGLPPINPLPSRETVKLGSAVSGLDNGEAFCDAAITELLRRDSGWLVYCLHGLDGEGWGPVTPAWLERTLERLLSIDSLAVLPTARVLALVDGL